MTGINEWVKLVKNGYFMFKENLCYAKNWENGWFLGTKSIFFLNLFIRFIWIVLDGSHYKKGKNDCLSFYEKFVICSKWGKWSIFRTKNIRV